ncbi:monocarboxylate transporter 3-like isoform X1 [Mytilus trossulus]|uniref:monocarboxylate transporter 3-like isoform X1 n=1 Tax=Mytilus trossulus TaxID=6551 RepID=UPI003005AAF1
MTLTSLGGSVTSVVFPLIVRTLLQTYGFRGAMLIHSAILLNTVICGAVVFPLTSKGLREDTDVDKEPLDMSFCKNPKFLTYLVTNFTLSIGYYMPPGLLPNTALSTGVSLDDISLAFSIGGIASILGRILFGFIAHRHPNQTTKLFSFFIIAMGLPMGIIPFSSTFIHYLVFCLINGFFLGGVNLGYNLSLRNILLPKYYGRGIGFGLLVQSLASLVGNPFAAFLQDDFGDGGIPFYLGMSILVLSGLVLLPFSSAIKETATEINIIVPSNRVTKRIKYNYSMNDIADSVVSYF